MQIFRCLVLMAADFQVQACLLISAGTAFQNVFFGTHHRRFLARCARWSWSTPSRRPVQRNTGGSGRSRSTSSQGINPGSAGAWSAAALQSVWVCVSVCVSASARVSGAADSSGWSGAGPLDRGSGWRSRRPLPAVHQRSLPFTTLPSLSPN